MVIATSSGDFLPLRTLIHGNAITILGASWVYLSTNRATRAQHRLKPRDDLSPATRNHQEGQDSFKHFIVAP